MQQTLILQSVPERLNKLFTMHRMARYAYKKQVMEEVGWEVKAQKIKAVKGPVILQFVLTFSKKRNRDKDNYLGGLKFVIDGLKDAGIIKDDNSDIVQSINCAFAINDKKETRIMICELE